MRTAKTLADLPMGTPVEIDGAYGLYKGLVSEYRVGHGVPWVKILFADGSDIIYYEEDLEEERIWIVEVT